MKHIKLFFLLILSIFVTTSYAAELTDAQKKFRDGVQQYLQSNGYSPYVDDSDNTLCFKKNGVLYWISVDEGNPFYVEFHRTGVKTQEKYNSNAVIIGNDITKMAKCVKAIKNTSTIGIVVEMFCHNASSFTKVFDRCYSVLNYGYDEADEDYSEIAGTTNAPFEYISGEVANVKYDNSVITHYGDPIYAYQQDF